MDPVPVQEPSDLVHPRGVPFADDSDSCRVTITHTLPALEQVRDDGQQIPLAVEGLDQEVIEQSDVDGVRRHRKVGVSTEQHRPDLRVKPPRLAQQSQAAHPRSALVGDRERDGSLALPEVLKYIDRGRRLVEAGRLIARGGEAAVEMALERPRHPRITPHP